MDNIIVGLDIGTTKIACFIGQRAENGKLRILGYGKTESIGVERGVVRNVTETANSIRKVVAEASNQAGVEVEEVYVGIAGQHIKSLQNHGSIMVPQEHKLITQEDVNRLEEEQNRIMLQPGERIVHIIPQVYIVDNEELSSDMSPVGVAGKCLAAKFHIVTCNSDNLHNIYHSVEAAGLKAKRVVLEPIASSYAVLNDLDRDAGVALVDIGGGTTDVAIFTEGIIRHTSVIPLAGNAITEDIRKGCSIIKSQAESLKVKFGSCLPSLESNDDVISIPGLRNQPPREISMKTLAGIIKARLQVILEQVSYEIERSGFNNQLLAGIVLTGGGAKMGHIVELSELITRTTSRIGTPDEHLEKSDEELSHPMYATGIGLVLYGLELEENEATGTQDDSENDAFGDDIFKSMGMQQAPSAPHEATPVDTIPTPNTETADADKSVTNKKGGKDKNGKRRRSLFDIINNRLNQMLTEDIDPE